MSKNESKTPKINQEILLKKIEEERKRKETELQRRKTVLDTISLLTEVVSDAELQDALNQLDVNSWDEVIEERFLGKLCGWPLCGKNVIIERNAQRYKLDKSRQKVFENVADFEKFCSKKCFQHSNHIKGQLNELPLWLTGERDGKQYDLHFNAEAPSTRAGEPETANERIEFVPDKLMADLNKLHIAENVASSSESEHENEGDNDEDELCQSRKRDDRLFLSDINSYISSRTGASSKNRSNEVKPPADVVTLSAKEMEEKLNRLRTKYGKNPRQSTKKPPVFVDPHVEKPQTEPKIKKVDNVFQDLFEKLKES